MRRLRALTYSGVVALTVFVYLALPTLRKLYGPVANIPVYVLVALVAGRLTWLFLVDRSGDGDPAAVTNPGSDVERANGAGDVGDAGDVDENVEDELASLREEL